MSIPAAGALRLPSSWKPIIPFCIYCLGSSIPTMIISTFLPQQTKQYFGSDSNAAVMHSIFGGVGAIMTLFTTGLMGLVADTVGRYPVFAISAFLNVLPFCAQCIFSPENMYWYEVAANMLPPLVGSSQFGNIALVIICVGDMYVEEERAAPMVVVIATYFVGIISAVVPAAVGLSNDTTSMIACGISFMTLVFVAFGGLPETLHENNRRTHDMAQDTHSEATHLDREEDTNKWEVVLRELKQPLAPLKHVFRSRLLLALVSTTVCLIFPLSIAETIAFYYYNACCDFTKKSNGTYLAILGVCYIVYTFTILPLLLRCLHTVTVVNLALVTLVLHMITIGAATEQWEILGIVAPLAGFPFMAFALLSQLASTCVRATEQGVVLGSLAAFKGITNSLGPIIGAQLFSAGEHGAHFPQLVWVVAGVVALVGVFICYFALRPMVLESTSIAGQERLGLLEKSSRPDTNQSFSVPATENHSIVVNEAF